MKKTDLRYIDKNTPVKRKNLFIMMGALRNIIAHHNAILNIDSLNHIKSISKPIFERYFKVDKIANNYINYYSKDTISYLNFISSFNDLILNLVAEISEEENFIFFDEM